MNRIYNKLARLRVEELQAELEELGVNYSNCKSKDDYIRLFVKKVAKSAKITPKKQGKTSITSMEDSDVESINQHLSHRYKDR